MKKPVALEVVGAADRRLAQALREYSLSELRYDWCCNLAAATKRIILAEVKRRGVTYEQWIRMGRGTRRGGPFVSRPAKSDN